MEAYKLPLDCNRNLPFHSLWRGVNDIGMYVFAILECQPQEDLRIAYNNLLASLCKAHALVYRLTAYVCSDCPSLVRETSSHQVVGDCEESTQVLVLYYLMREFIKKQILQFRRAMIEKPCIISAYVDYFEKFNASVSMLKAISTYLHWSWQKRGLPVEHVLLPTEVVSMHLWTEVILDTEVKDRLTAAVERVVARVRAGVFDDVELMENVKRLSFALLQLHNLRQTYYSSLIETPYIELMNGYYEQQKLLYRELDAEEYILACYNEIRREDLLKQFFLAPVSYDKVRAHLIETRIKGEWAFLSTHLRSWLSFSSAAPLDARRARCLAVIHELLECDSHHCCLHELLRSIVCQYLTDILRCVYTSSDDPKDTRSLTQSVLCAVRIAHARQQEHVRSIFAENVLLKQAILDGISDAISALFEMVDPGQLGEIKKNMAECLADFASGEVEQWQSQPAIRTNWVADVLGMLENKEAFYPQYMRRLEQRLLSSTHDLSRSEMEESITLRKERKMLVDLDSKHRNVDFMLHCWRMLRDLYELRGSWLDVWGTMFYQVRPLVLTKFVWPHVAQGQDTCGMHGVPSPIASYLHQYMDSHQSSKFGIGRGLVYISSYSVAVLLVRSPKSRWLAEPAAITTPAMGPNSSSLADADNEESRLQQTHPSMVHNDSTSVALGAVAATTSPPPPSRICVSGIQLAMALAFNMRHTWSIDALAAEVREKESCCLAELEPFEKHHIVQRSDDGRTFTVENCSFSASGVINLVPHRNSRGKSELPSATYPRERPLSKKASSVLRFDGHIVALLKKKSPQSFDEIARNVTEHFSAHEFSRRDVKAALEKLVDRQYVERLSDSLLFSFTP